LIFIHVTQFEFDDYVCNINLMFEHRILFYLKSSIFYQFIYKKIGNKTKAKIYPRNTNNKNKKKTST